ncbi:hypothetical protein BU23DRAFT_576723 [Bimuria novae-zelandiae CBS 107.79]|uniref:Ornithine decarboxylase antizyme n=1 Tax=Bimuria novae-zelandiae CBS 107.79 TaxID=1447943 RepID=A0A6A5VY96_9PLEO|nr:hypothetical protein BU23DRAFT_576723 [Bimuria novae-zelandiae CBS 107.79]
MAHSNSKRSSSSSSSNGSVRSAANVRASAYVVNASTAHLQGFHYSTTGAGGAECPPLAAKQSSSNQVGRARRGGAAYTITGECERLFCETLRAVFLGEGNSAQKDSLVMGMHNDSTTTIVNDFGIDVRQTSTRLMDSPSPEAFGQVHQKDLVSDWIEVWDYVGGIRFRGFVAEKDAEKAMVIFFDQNVIGGDLKAGLMALLELCAVDYFNCSRLVVCIDRHTPQKSLEVLSKDLGWIGFQLTTLREFSNDGDVISNKWLFMEMDT